MQKSRRRTRRHSIQTSLLLITLPAVILSLGILSFIGYLTATDIIKKNVETEMTQSLSIATESIEKSLSNNGMVAESLARSVAVMHQQLSQIGNTVAPQTLEESMYRSTLPSLAESNDETFGGGIWFEPYRYRQDIQYFSPYCMRENGQMTYVDNYSLGEGVSYTDQEWYKNVAGVSSGVVWSSPYYDDFAKISMVTASSPIYDGNGGFLGVATADIDLTDMQQMVLSLDVAANGDAFLIDQSGVYIADEDSEKILNANITEDTNASFSDLGRQMLNQAEGTGSYDSNGETYLAWYQQIPDSGWYIVTTAAQSDLMASAQSLGRTFVALCIFFVVLLTVVLFAYLRRGIVRPIHALEDVTQEIANGNLSATVQIRSNNEFGAVGATIGQMTDRLKLYGAYISEISDILKKMAVGDFNFVLKHDYAGEFAVLKTGLLNTQKHISETLNSIMVSADQVSAGAEQVSSGAQALSQGATEQASSVEELAATVQEINAKIDQNAKETHSVDQLMIATGLKIDEGKEKMNRLVAAMTEIRESSQQIQTIIKTIDDIAFQTNILALNAAVEAARAGVAGKGFAVVADEVRNLAGKSAEASKSTQELITASMQAVERGSALVEDTEKTLEEVSEQATQVVEKVDSIAEASTEQADAVAQITQGIDQVSSVVQTNSATAEESAAASEELSAQADMLKHLTSQFKIAGDSADDREQPVQTYENPTPDAGTEAYYDKY